MEKISTRFSTLKDISTYAFYGLTQTFLTFSELIFSAIVTKDTQPVQKWTAYQFTKHFGMFVFRGSYSSNAFTTSLLGYVGLDKMDESSDFYISPRSLLRPKAQTISSLYELRLNGFCRLCWVRFVTYFTRFSAVFNITWVV